jgi:hypothetical protein
MAVVIAAIGVGAAVVGLIEDAPATLPFLAPAALIVVLAWAAYWRPAVVVSPAGVEIRNVTRTIELPWPTIQRIDTKYALTLFTVHGQFSAWAAPAPGRQAVGRAKTEDLANLPESTYIAGSIAAGDLPTSSSGAAAEIIRRRWEELRDAGLLDNPVAERERPRITWHWVTLAVIGVLLAASVVGFVLA